MINSTHSRVTESELCAKSGQLFRFAFWVGLGQEGVEHLPAEGPLSVVRGIGHPPWELAVAQITHFLHPCPQLIRADAREIVAYTMSALTCQSTLDV